MVSKKFSIVILLALMFLVCSCTSQTNTENTSDLDDKEISYPIESGYPIENPETAYPLTFDSSLRGPDFYITRPVVAGAMSVSGTGPINVPILLLDISEVDLVLAKTTIDESGIFVFELNEPLIAQHLIGIKLGDISGTDFNENDFIYNENYYERPYVGILFDLVVVE